MWGFKLFVRVEQRLHNAFSLWLSVWYFRIYLLLNDFKQTLQDNTSGDFSSSLCLSMCFLKISLLAKDFEQTLQSSLSTDLLSPFSLTLWTLEWALTLWLVLKFLPLVFQGYDARTDFLGALLRSCLSSSPLWVWFSTIKFSEFVEVKHSFMTKCFPFWTLPICLVFTTVASSTKTSFDTPWKPRSAANSDSFRLKPLPSKRDAKRFLRRKNANKNWNKMKNSTWEEFLSRGVIWLVVGVQLVRAGWQEKGWELIVDGLAPESWTWEGEMTGNKIDANKRWQKGEAENSRCDCKVIGVAVRTSQVSWLSSHSWFKLNLYFSSIVGEQSTGGELLADCLQALQALQVLLGDCLQVGEEMVRTCHLNAQMVTDQNATNLTGKKWKFSPHRTKIMANLGGFLFSL